MSAVPDSKLFPGEVYQQFGGYPSLCYFQQGDPKKPLVVFIPGACHLARIAYACPGSQAEDFLAHEVKAIDHSMLALSYPLDHPVYPQCYPEFGLLNWAQQIIEGIIHHVSQYQDNRDVILLLWSASGRVISQLIHQGYPHPIFNLLHIVALDATPPLYALSEKFINFIDKQANGMGSFQAFYPVWKKMLEEQSTINEHDIIDFEKYRQHILGHIPVGIMSTSLSYLDGFFINDTSQACEEIDLIEQTHLPYLSTLTPQSKLDAYYAVTAQSNWQFILDRKFILDFIKPNAEKISTYPKIWDELKTLLSSYWDVFHQTIPGNHFYFVGAIGAKIIGDYVQMIPERTNSFQQKIHDIFRKI